jgi:ubiquinone/menaquinone biosynthesis C-methylase UbiE
VNTYALWNGYMRSYDFLTKVNGYRENMLDIAAAAEVAPGMRVLDAGSGTGNLSILLKQFGAQVTACDYCESAIQAHRKKDSEAVIIKTSLEHPLEFRNESFERVCCASVLFALTKGGCEQTIREFFRVLKPGGRLVITVPSNEASLTRLMCMHWRTLRGRHGQLAALGVFIRDMPALSRVLYYNRLLRGLPDWAGFHRFTAEELESLVISAGFRTANVRRTYGGAFLLLAAAKPAN